MKTLFISIATMIFSLPLNASDVLSELDLYFGNKNLSESFQDKSKVIGSYESCIWICDKYQYENRVDTKSNSQINVDTYANNELKSRMELTESMWTTINSNMVRAYVNNLQSYGFQVTLETLIPSNYRVKVNGVNTTLRTLTLTIKAVHGTGMKKTHELILTNELNGLAQILSKVEMSSTSNKSTNKILDFISP